MENQSLQPWDNKKIADRRRDTNMELVWEVAFGTERFYLTNDEKEFYVGELKKGSKFVELEGLVLTDRPLYIAPNEYVMRELRRKK